MNSRDERSEHWLRNRSAAWHSIEQTLPALEDGKPLSFKQLQLAVHAYPELARDVAHARSAAPNSRTTAYLELIYRRLHRVIFRQPGASFQGLGQVLKTDIPSITYALRWQIVGVLLGFVLAIFAGWWLVTNFPELATLFASKAMIEGLQRGELWTDGLLNIVPSSVLSLQIFTNNILVALATLCLGVLYGLGTFYIIGLNGLMLGGVFAVTVQHGMGGQLFDFVAAHGFVELSAIIIAGAIGFSIGESLARPGQKTRSRAFQDAVQRGTKLMALCVAFLIGAGLIEGYVSPNPAFAREAKIVIGVAYLLLFLVALCGWRLPFLSGRYTRR